MTSSLDTNPSVLLHGSGNSSIENLPVPSIQHPDDVIIRIAFVGVCGSDVHFWRNGGMGSKVQPGHPIVMGHEASGTVHSIGESVTIVKVGDKVAIEPGYPCRTCGKCKDGRYNLCLDMTFAASPVQDPNKVKTGHEKVLNGMLAKYAVLPADFVYKLPENIGLEEGVLVEPLAVGCHSVKTIGVKPDDTVIVFGCGTVGLMCAAVSREFGAKKVVIVDINAEKLKFARPWFHGKIEMETSQLELGKSPMEAAKQLIEVHRLGSGPDVVIEASGATSAIHTGIAALQKGGRFIQTGLGKETVEFPMMAVSEKELTIKGHFRYGAGDFELAVNLLTRKKVEVGLFISTIFDFEKAVDAWEATGRGEGIKNLIRGVNN